MFLLCVAKNVMLPLITRHKYGDFKGKNFLRLAISMIPNTAAAIHVYMMNMSSREQHCDLTNLLVSFHLRTCFCVACEA